MGPDSLSLKSHDLPTPRSPSAQPEPGRGGDPRAKAQGWGELEGPGCPAPTAWPGAKDSCQTSKPPLARGSVPSARRPHTSPAITRLPDEDAEAPQTQVGTTQAG